MTHPDFGRSVNPISTRGTDYAHLITTGTPGFSDLPTALGPDDSKVFNNLHTSLTVKFVVLNLVLSTIF